MTAAPVDDDDDDDAAAATERAIDDGASLATLFVLVLRAALPRGARSRDSLALSAELVPRQGALCGEGERPALGAGTDLALDPRCFLPAGSTLADLGLSRDVRVAD